MIATGIYKSSDEFNHSLQESGSDLELIESPQHKILISKAQEPDKVFHPDKTKIVCICVPLHYQL